MGTTKNIKTKLEIPIILVDSSVKFIFLNETDIVFLSPLIALSLS